MDSHVLPMNRFFHFFGALFTLFVIAFLWWPLAQLFGAALWNNAHLTNAIRQTLFSPVAGSLLRNTIFLGVFTSIGALILGAPLGIALCRTPRMLRAVFAVLCVMPLAVPPIVLATCWLQVSRTPPARSMAAIAATQPAHINPVFLSACVLALCFFPIVALTVATTLRRLPHDAEDAARGFGGSVSTWNRVLVPQLLPAIWGALGAVFLLSLWEMGAPDLLDARTYSVEIYRNLAADDALDMVGKNARAALSSLPMILLSAPALWQVLRAIRHEWGRNTIESNIEYSNASVARHESVLVTVASLIVLVLSPLLPLGVLAQAVGATDPALRIFAESWNDNSVEIFNTLQLSTMCAAVSVFVAFLLALSWRTWINRAQNFALICCVSPLLIAPILHGVALVSFWNTPQFPLVSGLMNESGLQVLDVFYDWCARFLMPLFGLLSRFVPLSILLLSVAARRTDNALFEAAQNLGATPTRASFDVLWRVLRAPMLGVFALIWALSGAELSVSVLTQQPGGQPLTLPIFQLMHIFVMDKVAALCLFLCGFSAFMMSLCGVIALSGKRR